MQQWAPATVHPPLRPLGARSAPAAAPPSLQASKPSQQASGRPVAGSGSQGHWLSMTGSFDGGGGGGHGPATRQDGKLAEGILALIEAPREQGSLLEKYL